MKEGGALVQTVNRWGNGQGVRLPQAIMKLLNISVGDELSVEVIDGRIIMTPTRKRPKTLAERFEGYKGTMVQTEYWTGGPVGKEVF